MPLLSEIYFHAFEGGSTETPPLVLLHGAGGHHLYWPSEVRRLTGYRVFALDLPGHGKSSGRGLQSIPAYAKKVLDWLAAAGLHRAVFVGHSMGSAIALWLAIHHPEHVAGLVLVGSGARLRVNPALLELTSHPATFPKAAEMMIQWYYSPQVDTRLVKLAGKRMKEIRPSVMHGDMLACNEFDVKEQVGEISQPTLLICGADDVLTPLRYSQFLAGAIPNARLELVAGAGHMVMLEKPQAVVDALLRFLPAVPHHPGEE
jgi:pimeloyl-ACP methyl ester carboxylesterase